MSIRFLNCFTCNARVPAHWRSGTLCLLVETKQGLVLVDTGLGQDDYVRKSGILRTFQLLTIVPLRPEEAAARQIAALGCEVSDVRHIVLTHMHFDHCGGLPDFPDARVHVHRREYEAFTAPPSDWRDLAYVRRHIAHRPDLALYDSGGEKWFDFDAIRLPFEPAMWLIPLFGHSRGHCGVAIQTPQGWHFHVGDSAAINFTEEAFEPLVTFVLGRHSPRLRQFRLAHPEVQMTTGHMWLDFFDQTRRKLRLIAASPHLRQNLHDGVYVNTCTSCELISRRDQGIAPLWDRIYRTAHWDVAHCYETSLPGWLVVIARRHIESLDELTDSEAVEWGRLIRRTSAALKATTGCIKTYVLQFAESPQHPHVHFHIVPRMAQLPENRRSTHIFEYLGVPEEERVSEVDMNAIASKVRQELLAAENSTL